MRRYQSGDAATLQAEVPGTTTRSIDLEAGERIELQAPTAAGRVGLFHAETGEEVLATSVDGGPLAVLRDGTVDPFPRTDVKPKFRVGVPRSGTYELLCVYGPRRLARTFADDMDAAPEKRDPAVAIRRQGSGGSYATGSLFSDSPIATELSYLRRTVDPNFGVRVGGTIESEADPRVYKEPTAELAFTGGTGTRGYLKYRWQQQLRSLGQFYPTFAYLRTKNEAIDGGLDPATLETRIRAIKERLFFSIVLDLVKRRFGDGFPSLKDVSRRKMADAIVRTAGLASNGQKDVVRSAAAKRFRDEIGFFTTELRTETSFETDGPSVVHAEPVFRTYEEFNFRDPDTDFVEDDHADNVLSKADAPKIYSVELHVPANVVFEFWSRDNQLDHRIRDVQLVPGETEVVEVQTGSDVNL